MKIEHIAIEEILEDFFFHFTTDRATEVLFTSIRESGIRTPLDVMPGDGGFQLIAGFKRLACAQFLGLSTMPVVVHEASEETVFYHALLEHRAMHAMNVVEKARVLQIIERVELSDSIKTDFLKLLDLPDQSNLLDAVKSILSLTGEVQSYIAQYNLSLRQSQMFTGLCDKDQLHFVQLAHTLNVRGVELGDLIETVQSIAVREDLQIQDVLSNDAMTSVLRDDNLTISTRISRIKEMLTERRYPRLSAWNRELDSAGKSMRLPNDARLSWDKSLERPGILLQARMKSVAEVEALTDALQVSETLTRFQRMFEIM